MDFYLFCRALHLISMVAWFAGLFYLPRLFVYHVEQPEAGPTLQIMERKLAYYIMRPAALATAVFGMALIHLNPAVLEMGWLHAKLLLVFLLVVYQFSLEAHMHNLANGTNTKSGRFFRMYNELPTLALIIIIILAVFKPF